jgi:mRNA-degrading endonuclease RelE of RelBE toxin-antitoxin system
LVKELLRIIISDPFDRSFTCKLKGEWEGCRRARKGYWRVIYFPPEDDVICVVYIRSGEEKTYRRQ